MSHLLDGDADGADAVLSEAAELCLHSGAMPTAALALAERAVLAIARHDWHQAEALSSQAMTVVRDSNVDGYLFSTVVHAVAARTAVHRGDVDQAREHVVAASRLRPLCSAALPMSTQFLLQLANAYLELADPAGARAVLRQIRDILSVRPDIGIVPSEADDLEHRLDMIRVGPFGASSLTTAELRVLPLLATHLSHAEIGERLHISRNTVKSHAAAISRKLGASSRSEAIRTASEIGLLGR
jgi:LuxR family maltose regulon positive regulatory protein